MHHDSVYYLKRASKAPEYHKAEVHILVLTHHCSRPC